MKLLVVPGLALVLAVALVPLAATNVDAAPAAPQNLQVKLSADGTAVLSWSAVKGAASYRLQRNRVRIASPETTSHSDTLTSDGTYSYRVRAVDGNGVKGPFSGTVEAAYSSTLLGDGEVSPPTVAFAHGEALTASAVPVIVSWPAGTGAERYELQRKVDKNWWRATSEGSTLSARVMLRPGTLNRFRLRAIDSSGSAGPWATGEALWLAVVQDTDWQIEWDGSWAARAISSAFGGSLMRSSQAGATAGVAVAGHQLAWVAKRSPTSGRATVSVDGKKIETVDLEAPATEDRRIVLTASWQRGASRSVEVEVEGTPNRPRVDIDAVLTLGAPPTGVLVGAGDIARCDRPEAAAAAAATGEMLKSLDGVVFTAGDNVQQKGTATEFGRCYDPRWGHLKSRTRPVPGNHEYKTTNATPYFDYFGKLAGPRGQGWYAYDVGTWRVYALNSNCSFVGGCDTTSAQYAWLQQDLAANRRRCVAAVWHHPRFSSGGAHGSSTLMEPIHNLLYKNGADVVLSGHDHNYERLAPMNPSGEFDPSRGIRHFTVGTGGSTLREAGTPLPTSEALDSDTHGVLKLTLGWSKYSWEFMPVPGGDFGTFRDAGSGTCH
jgi:3',5'-cyclic AMP phosphodiesterase CpdA